MKKSKEEQQGRKSDVSWKAGDKQPRWREKNEMTEYGAITLILGGR